MKTMRNSKKAKKSAAISPENAKKRAAEASRIKASLKYGKADFKDETVDQPKLSKLEREKAKTVKEQKVAR